MKFTTECTVLANNTLDVALPEMTSRGFVPNRLTVYVLEGPKGDRKEIEAKELQLKVRTKVELLAVNEPYFEQSNVIDLDPYIGLVHAYGRVHVQIANKAREPRTFSILTEYVASSGGVIYQERTDNFDKVLENILSKGSCTSITVSFDKPISKLMFLTTSTCVDGDWIQSFEAEVDNDANFYTFDFTDEDMREYQEFLGYMRLSVSSVNNEAIRAYVTAYGFPHAAK